MKRTEKSKVNSRQKSMANSRQGKPKDNDRQAKHEEKHTSEESCSQPVPDVQHGQHELKFGEGITTIPKIDFNEEIVEYIKIIQIGQEQRLRKSRRP